MRILVVEDEAAVFLGIVAAVAYPLYAIALGARRTGRELQILNARLDRYLNASDATGAEHR